jgi:hypothetical protein
MEVTGDGEVVALPEPQPLPPASSFLFFSFPSLSPPRATK